MQIVAIFFVFLEKQTEAREGLPERGAYRKRSVGDRRSQRPTISLRLQLRLRSFSLSLLFRLRFDLALRGRLTWIGCKWYTGFWFDFDIWYILKIDSGLLVVTVMLCLDRCVSESTAWPTFVLRICLEAYRVSTNYMWGGPQVHWNLEQQSI